MMLKFVTTVFSDVSSLKRPVEEGGEFCFPLYHFIISPSKNKNFSTTPTSLWSSSCEKSELAT